MNVSLSHSVSLSISHHLSHHLSLLYTINVTSHPLILSLFHTLWILYYITSLSLIHYEYYIILPLSPGHTKPLQQSSYYILSHFDFRPQQLSAQPIVARLLLYMVPCLSRIPHYVNYIYSRTFHKICHHSSFGDRYLMEEKRWEGRDGSHWGWREKWCETICWYE